MSGRDVDGPVWALGLMSGTSMDGIDAAIVETDGVRVTAFGPAATTPYPDSLRAAIRASLGRSDPDAALVRSLTDAHAGSISALLGQFPEFKERIRLVGLHGHTVLHAPRQRRTLQIGDGARLAAATGFDVVFDFRSADVAAGGEGAPLAPLYHRALCRDIEGPVAVLNIGGISNVTWIGGDDDDPVAFDTGPGNALLDDWVAGTTGLDCDRDGQVSAAGRVDADVLAALLRNPYFAAPPPKSLDRLDFANDAVRGLSPGDGAATLARFTAEAIARGVAHLPSRPVRWLVTGGGRRNPTIMEGLREALGVPVDPVEAVGWDGDALEAQAFAFLAVRSVRGLPLSVPTTTGVPVPTTGGRLSRAAA
jgi:anhydro-N-acetylmuramic acid kinase